MNVEPDAVSGRMNKILQISRPVQRIPHARIHPPARFSRPDGGNPCRLRPTDGIERIPEGERGRRGRIVTVSSEQYPFQRAPKSRTRGPSPAIASPAGVAWGIAERGPSATIGGKETPPLPGGPSPAPGPRPRRAPLSPGLRRRWRIAGTRSRSPSRAPSRESPRAPSASGASRRGPGRGRNDPFDPGRPPGRNPRRDGGTRNLPCALGVPGSVGRRRSRGRGHHHVRSADLRSGLLGVSPVGEQDRSPAETTRAALLPVKPVR